MKWLLKSGAQAAFARIPGGRHVNRLFQGDVAYDHIPSRLENLERMNCVLSDKTRVAVEVGTGWCPAVPLGLTARGIHVHTYDLTRFVTPRAIEVARTRAGGNWGMVEYHAPADAAGTELPDASVDLHFSFSVFEHLPVQVMKDILREAFR